MSSYPNNDDIKAIFALAKSEIESYGWTVNVSKSDVLNDNEIHIELTKSDERKGWGYFPDMHCWSQAYNAITGKDILYLSDRAKAALAMKNLK